MPVRGLARRTGTLRRRSRPWGASSSARPSSSSASWIRCRSGRCWCCPRSPAGAALALMMAPPHGGVAQRGAAPRDADGQQLPKRVPETSADRWGIALLNTSSPTLSTWHAIRIGETIPVESQAFAVRLGYRVLPMVARHEPGLVAHAQSKVILRGGPGQSPSAPRSRLQQRLRTGGLILLSAIPLCFLLKARRPPRRGGEKAGGTVAAAFLAD